MQKQVRGGLENQWHQFVWNRVENVTFQIKLQGSVAWIMCAEWLCYLIRLTRGHWYRYQPQMIQQETSMRLGPQQSLPAFLFISLVWAVKRKKKGRRMYSSKFTPVGALHIPAPRPHLIYCACCALIGRRPWSCFYTWCFYLFSSSNQSHYGSARGDCGKQARRPEGSRFTSTAFILIWRKRSLRGRQT